MKLNIKYVFLYIFIIISDILLKTIVHYSDEGKLNHIIYIYKFYKEYHWYSYFLFIIFPFLIYHMTKTFYSNYAVIGIMIYAVLSNVIERLYYGYISDMFYFIYGNKILNFNLTDIVLLAFSVIICYKWAKYAVTM